MLFEDILKYMATLRGLPDSVILTDMIIGLILGSAFGYERSYNGRAAGMRTYGIVCMVAAGLTSSSVHIGPHIGLQTGNMFFDPTRTIQGIVTGVGFIGAGIIMKDAMRISGLTTAASVWASAAIGIVVGCGFYISASAMALLAICFMVLGPKFDKYLPGRRPIFVSLKFNKDFSPHSDLVHDITGKNGYSIARNSIVIRSNEGQVEWCFVAVDVDSPRSLGDLADAFSKIEGLDSFHVSRTRN